MREQRAPAHGFLLRAPASLRFRSALPLRFVFAPRSRFAYPAVLQQVLRFVEQLHVDAEIRDVATETLDVL